MPNQYPQLGNQFGNQDLQLGNQPPRGAGRPSLGPGPVPDPVAGVLDADDKRPLFQRIIDDIRHQVSEGQLRPGDKVLSVPALARSYGVCSMTAQRVYRELHQQGITFSVAGRGTFVHPSALAALQRSTESTTLLRSPAEPGLTTEVRAYLAAEYRHVTRYMAAVTAADREAALAALLAHIARHHRVPDSPQWKEAPHEGN